MKHLSQDGETVTIHKFAGLEPPSKKREEQDRLALILDVETTGLSAQVDRAIQLAIRPFYFDPETYEVTGIAKQMVFYNDPGEPLREEIIEITGITDDDVSGEKIDWEWIRNALHRAEVIITHNVPFDRQFVEAELVRAGLPYTDGPIWCCSMRQVDWRAICKPSNSLEVLCAWSGFFYDSHKADADVDALFHLLRKNEKIKELIERGTSPEHRVFAVGSPIEMNPLLKRRWYRWDPGARMWWKGFEKEEDANSEIEWLKENIDGVDPQVFEVDPKYRYSPE